MGTASFKSFDPGGTRSNFTSAGSETFTSAPASEVKVSSPALIVLIVPSTGAALAGAAACPASCATRGPVAFPVKPDAVKKTEQIAKTVGPVTVLMLTNPFNPRRPKIPINEFPSIVFKSSRLSKVLNLLKKFPQPEVPSNPKQSAFTHHYHGRNRSSFGRPPFLVGYTAGDHASSAATRITSYKVAHSCSGIYPIEPAFFCKVAFLSTHPGPDSLRIWQPHRREKFNEASKKEASRKTRALGSCRKKKENTS